MRPARAHRQQPQRFNPIAPPRQAPPPPFAVPAVPGPSNVRAFNVAAAPFVPAAAQPAVYPILQHGDTNTTDGKEVISDFEFDQFARLLHADYSRHAQAAATSYFRRIYSKDVVRSDSSRHIDPFLVPNLIRCMTSAESPDTQLDAAWALTNLACTSSDITHSIVDSNGIEALVEGVSHGKSEYREQCIWALGNIAADCSRCKQRIRQTPLLVYMAGHLLNPRVLVEAGGRAITARKNMIWCILNVVRGGHRSLPIECVRDLVRGLHHTVRDCDADTERNTVKDAVWAIAFLADDIGRGLQVDVILEEPGLVALIMETLWNGPKELHSACLRALGNLITGNDAQTGRVLAMHAFLDIIHHYLLSDNPSCAREAAWICSNVAAGPAAHIEYMFKKPELYDGVRRGMHSTDRKMKKECLWTIVNMLSGADDDRLEWLVATGVVSLYPTIVAASDARLVDRAMTSLGVLMRDFPQCICQVEEMNLLDLIKPEIVLENENIYNQGREVAARIKTRNEKFVARKCVSYRFTPYT